jgi:hypothetical protein
MFCAACGRNLAGVDRLPTRAEWEAEHPSQGEVVDDRPLDERCAEATASFLAAMHAAQDPGVTKIAISHSGLGRKRMVQGWIVRPVHRDDPEDAPHRYTPGLMLTTDGQYHLIESQVRGYGTRDFPRFEDKLAEDPVHPPVDEQIIAVLAQLLRDNGVSAGGVLSGR